MSNTNETIVDKVENAIESVVQDPIKDPSNQPKTILEFLNRNKWIIIMGFALCVFLINKGYNVDLFGIKLEMKKAMSSFTTDSTSVKETDADGISTFVDTTETK